MHRQPRPARRWLPVLHRCLCVWYNSRRCVAGLRKRHHHRQMPGHREGLRDSSQVNRRAAGGGVLLRGLYRLPSAWLDKPAQGQPAVQQEPIQLCAALHSGPADKPHVDPQSHCRHMSVCHLLQDVRKECLIFDEVITMWHSTVDQLTSEADVRQVCCVGKFAFDCRCTALSCRCVTSDAQPATPGYVRLRAQIS